MYANIIYSKYRHDHLTSLIYLTYVHCPEDTFLSYFTIFPVKNSGRTCPVILLVHVTLTEVTA